MANNAYGQALQAPLSLAAIVADAMAAGFSGNGLATIVAISMAESGFVPNATNVNTNGSIDRGVLQINDEAWPSVTTAQAFNPSTAFSIAYNQISQQGTNFQPWSTFGNGAYKQYMSLAGSVSGGPSVRTVLQRFYDPSDIAQGYGVPELGNAANGMHSGVDYMQPLGTPIPALASGTVVSVTAGCPVVSGVPDSGNSCGGGFGNHPVIRLSDGSNRTMIYGHMQKLNVKTGDSVAVGQIIGWVGMTGFTTGPHVHVELDKAGTEGGGFANSLDPTSFIAQALASAPTTPAGLVGVGTASDAASSGNGWFSEGTLAGLTSVFAAETFTQNVTHINGFDGMALGIKRAEAFVPFQWSNPIGSFMVNARAFVLRALTVVIGVILIVGAVSLFKESGAFTVVTQAKEHARQVGEDAINPTADELSRLPTEDLAV